jgi:tetratricopeptide (TPR) repeat protein
MLLMILGLCSVSASTGDDAARCAAQGNTAFEQGDYAAAVRCYSAAEQRTTDPGLVAFNKAAALYRLGQYRDAELHYLRCVETAPTDRRCRALYNAANAVVLQTGASDPSRLKLAIGYYQDALHPVTDAQLEESILQNLALARALLKQAMTAKNPSKRDNNSDHHRGAGENGGLSDSSQVVDPDSTGRSAAKKDDGPGGTKTSKRTLSPGAGNLPVIPDRPEAAPLPSEDAARYLEEVAERVRRDRFEHRKRHRVPASPNVRDW